MQSPLALDEADGVVSGDRAHPSPASATSELSMPFTPSVPKGSGPIQGGQPLVKRGCGELAASDVK
jgi:hypothetical protein